MPITEIASLHSATSFLNALFLEWPHYQFDKENNSFSIILGDEKVIVPLTKFSKVGRHHYKGEFLNVKNNTTQKISFIDFAEKISAHLAKSYDTDKAQLDHFLMRLKNSVQNIAQSLNKRITDLEDIFQGHVDFKTAEQGLFVGHTFHPTPKSRGEFSDADFERYSPEMAGLFPLEWLLVSEEILYQKFSSNFNKSQWLTDIFIKEFYDSENATKKLKDGFIAFPVHPWQKKYILAHKDVKKYISAEKILFLNEGQKHWYPTSSLRTLFGAHADYMLKFSMNVKLTNSVRNLLVHELDRGLQVHDVFTHQKGQEFLQKHPEFEVIYEPVYAGIKDSQGNPIQESLIVGRFNPFKMKTESIVLATLTQDHPEFENNLIQFYISELSKDKKITVTEASLKWFQSFLDVAINPLIDAQANYGILLGSHQQNMVIEVRDHLPAKSYFRDCNGTGYSPLGQTIFAKEVKSLNIENGNILTEDITSYLFGYYVIINSTFNTLSSVAHTGWINEEALIDCFRDFLVKIKESKPQDISFLNYLLESESLMHKGNFLCSFRNINENTEKNPLSIYTKIPNPLFKANSL